MKYRLLGNTNYNISEISLGTWQLGSKWGEPFDEETALKTLESAYENGINFLDTADCYQNGLSEKVIGKFIKTKKEKIYVSTKCGRKLKNFVFEEFNEENITNFVLDSLKNMDVESLDLLLLHCPPTEVFYNENVFKHLDNLKEKGLIKHYGVSVEKVEEAIKALDYNISAIEIIFNMFRLKPKEDLFKLAKEKNVGIIVRVPLASGLLSGKFSEKTVFNPNDHRTTNRNGERFDKGETFSGVDYETGLRVSSLLKDYFKDKLNLYALKYCLSFDISTVIPGASSYKQIEENVKAIDLPELTKEQLDYVEEVYNSYLKEIIHPQW